MAAASGAQSRCMLVGLQSMGMFPPQVSMWRARVVADAAAADYTRAGHYIRTESWPGDRSASHSRDSLNGMPSIARWAANGRRASMLRPDARSSEQVAESASESACRFLAPHISLRSRIDVLITREVRYPCRFGRAMRCRFPYLFRATPRPCVGDDVAIWPYCEILALG